MILAAAVAVQCTDDEQTEQAKHENTLQVSLGSEVVMTEYDLDWRVVVSAADNTATLYMNKTHFVSQMPLLDMVAPDFEIRAAGGAYSFDCPVVIPTHNGTPMEEFALTSFAGSLSGETLHVTFNCMGHRVEFDGKITTERK